MPFSFDVYELFQAATAAVNITVASCNTRSLERYHFDRNQKTTEKYFNERLERTLTES